MTIRAKYEDGVFKPLERVDLKEGTLLDIDVPAKKAGVRSVRKYSFVGMWKGRRDIRDGISYVDELRQSSRT